MDLKSALDQGITLIDTGDFYGSGQNELLVGEALRGRPRDQIVVSVKFGALRDPRGGFIGHDLRPAAIKNLLLLLAQAAEHRPHRRLPAGAHAARHRRRGGRGGRSPSWSRRATSATSACPRWAPRRFAAPRRCIPSWICRSSTRWSRGGSRRTSSPPLALGTGITAYGVLSRGLLSGHWTQDRALARGDFRSFSARFRGANLEKYLGLVDALREVARRKGISVAQAAIAWGPLARRGHRSAGRLPGPRATRGGARGD